MIWGCVESGLLLVAGHCWATVLHTVLCLYLYQIVNETGVSRPIPAWREIAEIIG